MTTTTLSTEDRLARLAERGAARRSPDTGHQPRAGARQTAGQPDEGGAHGPRPPAGRPPAPPRSPRHHAARGSRTAALLLSLATTIGLTGYFRTASADEAQINVTAGGSLTTTAQQAAALEATATGTAPTTTAAAPPVATPPSTTATTTASTSPTSTSTAAKAATVASSGLADGTFTGSTNTNRWGPVQVQVVVSGGKISQVNVLQVPNSNGKDVAINNRAVPILVQSTLAAQNAQIDAVSGATYTSTSYVKSLQSALDAAAAANGH